MRKYLNSLFLLVLCISFIFPDSLEEALAEISAQIDSAESLYVKESGIKERAHLYELAGMLELAISDYRLLSRMNPDAWQYKRDLFLLKMEIGEKDLLEEISRELLNSSSEHKIFWVSLQVRYLISIGQWDEAEALIRQYQSAGERDASFVYLAWFVFSYNDQNREMEYWLKILQERFPQSPEAMISLGLAMDSPSPEKLLLSRVYVSEKKIYFYQVGAYRRIEGARELSRQLAEINLESEIVDQGDWYKVLVPSSNAQDDTLEDQLIDLGYKPFRVNL